MFSMEILQALTNTEEINDKQALDMVFYYVKH